MKTGWTNVVCKLDQHLEHLKHVDHSREKYETLREGVMEEMEITSAGLVTVRSG